MRPSADTCRIRLRSLTILAPGAAAGAAVVTLAFASGGYHPADHGLLPLAFALVALAAVLAADEVSLDRRSFALVGGLAGLALWAFASVIWAPAAAWPVLEAERGLLYAVAAAALVLVVTRARVTSLLAGVVTGITAVSLYALASRLFPGHVGGVYDPSSGYQLAEPIGYWNALGLLLVLGVLATSRSAAGRSSPCWSGSWFWSPLNGGPRRVSLCWRSSRQQASWLRRGLPLSLGQAKRSRLHKHRGSALPGSSPS